jgi:Ca-activated chloride channel family protein
MLGYQFHELRPDRDKRTPFERLLELFTEVVTHTSGDVEEAMDWMRTLDEQHGLTEPDYTLDDFYEDLKAKGFLREATGPGEGGVRLGSRGEQHMRKRALDQIFGNLKKGTQGRHRTKDRGQGDEPNEDRRAYRFGDKLDQVDFSASLRNAQINHGIGTLSGRGGFRMTEDDLVVEDREFRSTTSTVLMIDISHSMILYGEDRITPAKKVAMALAELVMVKYPKDTLDIVVFGDDAWEISVADLPYLQVGPFHTNTVAGLERAMDILRRKKTPNRQIFMVTDGKPSCLKEADGYYKNSFGLDPYITGKCHNLARQCRKLGIPITTFMIATDPALQRFVSDFTEANNGRAFFTGLQGLGDTIFADFERNRRGPAR